MKRLLDPHALPVRVQKEFKPYPHYDHSSRECFLNLERTHVAVRPLFERLFRPYGISGSTFNVLMILRSAETALAPHAIGEQIVVTRPTVTGLLETLESRGLIRREPDPDDGRRRRVGLTKSGGDLVETVLPEVFALEKDIFSGLTSGEKETLINLLGKIEATAIGTAKKKRRMQPRQVPRKPTARERLRGGKMSADA